MSTGWKLFWLSWVVTLPVTYLMHTPMWFEFLLGCVNGFFSGKLGHEIDDYVWWVRCREIEKRLGGPDDPDRGAGQDGEDDAV